MAKLDEAMLAETAADDYWSALEDIELLVRELYGKRGEDEETSRICNLIFKRSPTVM